MFCLLVELKKVKDAKNIVPIQMGLIKEKKKEKNSSELHRNLELINIL